MIRLNWASKSESYLRFATVACGILIAIVGAVLKFDAESLRLYFGWEEKAFASEFVRLILLANTNNAWWWIPALTFIAAIASFFRSSIGNKHKWSCVAALLEEYRNSVFDHRAGFESRAKHFDRVTLFKYTRFRIALCKWPWSGWMVPVARTGHATITPKIPRFICPLGAPSKAEGIAGTSFANNAEVPGYKLPELDEWSPIKDKLQYAKYGQVSLDWIEERIKRDGCLRTRSLRGVPIEVKGQKWGAIVIDSTDPEKIRIDDERSKKEFRILSRLLTKLLEDG